MTTINIRENGIVRGVLHYNTSGSVPEREDNFDTVDALNQRMADISSYSRISNMTKFRQYYPTAAGGRVDEHYLAFFFKLPDCASPDIKWDSVYATHRILNTVSALYADSEDASQHDNNELLTKLDRMLDDAGAWTFLDRSIIPFLAFSLVPQDDEASESQRWCESTAVCGALQSMTTLLQWMISTHIDEPYKGLRSPVKAATSWKQTMLMTALQHMGWSDMSRFGDMAIELVNTATTAIEDFFSLRKVRLDTNNCYPQLTPNEPTVLGHRRFGERIVNLAPTLDVEHGGIAADFNGYKINVAMAYSIMAQVYRATEDSRRNGNYNSTLRWHLYRNPSSNTSPFPIIGGGGNEKHLNAIRLIKVCTDLIIQCPPVAIPITDEYGEASTTYRAYVGEVHHDISGNRRINETLNVCSRCSGIIATGEEVVKHGSVHRGRIVNAPSNPDSVWCANCCRNLLFVSGDSEQWCMEGDYEQFSVGVYNIATPLRLNSYREFRIHSSTAHALRQFEHRCSHCSYPTYRPAEFIQIHSEDEDVRQFIDALAGGDIQPDSVIGKRINASIGRNPAQDRNYVYRVNTSVSLWDGGMENPMCTRCYNTSNVYTDPATGRMYSHADASPNAPTYGYIVPDETDQYLNRVIGIEFETGTGSSRVPDKDNYLNSRCSDSLHVWHIHNDGSLMGGACEITTPPIGGLAIPKAVDAMFSLAHDHGFNIENHKAGMHIHTDITDLFEVMLPIREDYHKKNRVGQASGHAYPAFCSLLGKFGDVLALISHKFVSLRRRSNHYCSGGFGIRSWDCGTDPMASYTSTLSTSGRQAVCIHKHSGYALRKKVTYTLENRIWPSSNSKEYTLARCELTQKAIDAFVGVAKRMLTIEDCTELTGFIAALHGIRHQPVNLFVDKLCDYLLISQETREALSKLHRRYFWVSYYAHDNGLDMDGQEIRTLVLHELARIGISATSMTGEHRIEMAGIMMGKSLPNTSTPLSNPGDAIVMDTIISSDSYSPVATDHSDLVAVPSTTLINTKY